MQPLPFNQNPHWRYLCRTEAWELLKGGIYFAKDLGELEQAIFTGCYIMCSVGMGLPPEHLLAGYVGDALDRLISGFSIWDHPYILEHK